MSVNEISTVGIYTFLVRKALNLGTIRAIVQKEVLRSLRAWSLKVVTIYIGITVLIMTRERFAFQKIVTNNENIWNLKSILP